MARLSDAEITALLTKIGMLYLKSKLCHIIAPEIKPLRISGRGVINLLENHYTIDLVGIGKKYIPYGKQVKTVDEGRLEHRQCHIYVTRGIEIKVSRSDFKRGFVQSGCNYHYLMTPKGLVRDNELPNKIGLIEVDLEAFNWHQYQMRYIFEGIVVKRNPRFQELDEVYLETCMRQAASACSDQMIRWARQSLPLKTWRIKE